MASMTDQGELDLFALRLGRLFSNYLSLEFYMRAAIAQRCDANDQVPDYASLKEGDCVPITWLTNDKPLKRVIKKFNHVFGAGLDATEISARRNAIAHAQAMAFPPAPLRLVKFALPWDKSVCVERVIPVLDEGRFDEEMLFTDAQRKMVREVIAKAGLDGF